MIEKMMVVRLDDGSLGIKIPEDAVKKYKVREGTMVYMHDSDFDVSFTINASEFGKRCISGLGEKFKGKLPASQEEFDSCNDEIAEMFGLNEKSGIEGDGHENCFYRPGMG